MSYAFKQFDQDVIDSFSNDVEALLKEIFGSDIAISFKLDGTADLNIVGGDIALSGSATGNTVKELEELARIRLMTRLLTYYSESPLLPSGYGSFLTDVIGLSIVDSLDTDVGGSNIQLNDIEAFINGIIQYSLQDEPLVTQVNDITVEIDQDNIGTLLIGINFSSLFMENLNANLVLVGD